MRRRSCVYTVNNSGHLELATSAIQTPDLLFSMPHNKCMLFRIEWLHRKMAGNVNRLGLSEVKSLFLHRLSFKHSMHMPFWPKRPLLICLFTTKINWLIFIFVILFIYFFNLFFFLRREEKLYQLFIWNVL